MSTMIPGSSVDDLQFFFEDWHRTVVDEARAIATDWRVEDERDDRQATIDAVHLLAKAGLTRYCVPECVGGAAVGKPDGVDTRAITLVREALGWADSLLDTAFAMQGLGSYPITMAGSDEQKARYLPRVMSGESLGAFALTEPGAGSDVASMTCHARKDGDDWVLNGEKTYISNAGIAGQYVVFATIDPELKGRGITAFIVEPDDAGLAVEPFEVIAPHPIGKLIFKDCRIPGDRLLGEEGRGFKIAMGTLDVFRTTVGGAALVPARGRVARSQYEWGAPK